jgi:hypothetical protein
MPQQLSQLVKLCSCGTMTAGAARSRTRLGSPTIIGRAESSTLFPSLDEKHTALPRHNAGHTLLPLCTYGLAVGTAHISLCAYLQLFLGETNRTISETPMNMASSRSHCIFTLHVESRQVGCSDSPCNPPALRASGVSAFCYAIRHALCFFKHALMKFSMRWLSGKFGACCEGSCA